MHAIIFTLMLVFVFVQSTLGHPNKILGPSTPFKDILGDALQLNAVDSDTQSWLKFEGRSKNRIPNHFIHRKDNQDPDRTYFPKRPKGIKKGDRIFNSGCKQ